MNNQNISKRGHNVNFIERNKERVSLISAGTKAFNQLNVPLKTTLTHLVFNNSGKEPATDLGQNQMSYVQEKLVQQLRAKIEKEKEVVSEIKTLEELYQNLLEQSEFLEIQGEITQTQQQEGTIENDQELMSPEDEEEIKNFEETKEM